MFRQSGRDGLDNLECLIYTSGMFAREAGQTLVAKRRGPARQVAPRQAMIPAGETAVTELIQATGGKTVLLDQGQG